ncbi:hypothetical protein DL93DRAFT_2228111, partial [Clavulina sp. PMI_390]
MPCTISSLPNELLLLVSRHAVSIAAADSPRVIVTTLLALTSINSLWRDLFVRFSSLWTNIHVKLSEPTYSTIKNPPRPLPNDFARVAAFLKRSKNSPIHLTLRRSWHVTGATWDQEKAMVDDDWRSMHELLAPHLERCWLIDCVSSSLPVEHTADLPRLLERSSFPLLQELRIG